MTDAIPTLLTIWLVIALAVYRTQRLITADKWPLAKYLRAKVDTRFGPESSWAEFISCPWCLGTWVTIVLATLTHVHVVDLMSATFRRPAVFLLYIVAALSTIVGSLGRND